MPYQLVCNFSRFSKLLQLDVRPGNAFQGVFSDGPAAVRVQQRRVQRDGRLEVPHQVSVVRREFDLTGILAARIPLQVKVE